MKVLVIGSGGREYSICKRLHEENPELDLFCLPGNPAMTFLTRVPDIGVKETEQVLAFAQEKAIDFCLVTPDDPLALGLVDLLEGAGIPCFGPVRAAARLESSKAFAKSFMLRHGIPTAGYAEFDDYEQALSYCREQSYPLVIKADGLALGKGVEIVADPAAAKAVLADFLLKQKFGESSARVIVEEFLEGPEISVLSFCDGKTILPMISSMDHKAAYDGDRGPNTGGMGCVAPNPYYTAEVEQSFRRDILEPTLKGLSADGLDFRGCLYFGLMLTSSGLKLLEYNARFGDPETQVILPLLKSNLWEVLQLTSKGQLDRARLEFSDGAACCIVMAAEGYPVKPVKGGRITYPANLEDQIIFAGVGRDAKGYFATSGRVLNVIGLGPSLGEAVATAYNFTEQITFKQSFYRHDIGRKALQGEDL